MMKASIGITTNMNVSSTNWLAENADSMGAESIWIGEDIDLGQDPFVLTSTSLLKSNNVRVGTGIVPVTVHNISTLARAALTLNEIGNGRFILGIGIGGIQDLIKYGIQINKPVTQLRESISILRRLWRGETVTTNTELFHLTDYSLRLSEPVEIPIYLGVRGPQMLKLAGKYADGVILSGPFDYLKHAMSIIDKAARDAGRQPSEIERIAWSATIPTFRGGKEKLAKKVVSIIVADTPDKVLDMLSIDREKIERIKTAVAKSGPNGGIPFVDNEILDMFAVSGTKEHMVDIFESIGKLGVTEAVVGPPFSGQWKEAVTEIFQEIHARR